MTPVRFLLLSLVLLFAGAAALLVRPHREHREEIARIEQPELLERLHQRQEALASSPKAMLNLETAEIMDPTKATVSAGSWKDGDSVLDGAVGLDGVLRDVLVGSIELEVRVEDASGKATSLWTRQLSADEIPPEGMWLHFSAPLTDVARGNISLIKRHVPTLMGRFLGTGRPDPLGVVVWRKPTPRPAQQDGKPNVILISLDTLRADHLGIAGYDRDTTPNLDEIAREGLWFDTVVAQAPWTRPSHHSILTGTNPTKHGVTQPIQVTEGTWRSPFAPLAEVFRDRGYATAAFTGSGSISAKFGFDRGFDFYNETTGKEHECMSDAARVFGQTRRWVAEHADRTFFLFVHTYEPHKPYCDRHFVEREHIDPKDQIKDRVARYDGDIRRTDMHLEQLFEALHGAGLFEKTIVVVTSDHGEQLVDRLGTLAQFAHGHSLYDELLLVPLVFAGGPVRGYAGRVSKQVRSIDIFPTVLELAGIPVPDYVDGRSLLGLAQGEADEERSAYSGATNGGPHRDSIRDGGWKLIRTLGPHAVRGGEPKGLRRELYNLDEDPRERSNLAGRQARIASEYEDLLSEITAQEDRPRDAQPQPEETPSVDPQLVEQLRRLGYID
jgi:arylsulfatase A-like enzyme